MARTSKIKLDDKTLSFITKRIKEGATEGSIAQELGLHPTSFSKMKTTTPLLEETIRNAQTNIESEVVGYLMQMIRNPEHKNHASSVYFYLKTRCRWRETDPTPAAIIAPDGMRFRLIQDQDLPKAEEDDEATE